jgi:hypothetical protein
MTPELHALLIEARALLLVLAPLCQHLPPSKSAAHLPARCTGLAERIGRQLPKEVA